MQNFRKKIVSYSLSHTIDLDDRYTALTLRNRFIVSLSIQNTATYWGGVGASVWTHSSNL